MELLMKMVNPLNQMVSSIWMRTRGKKEADNPLVKTPWIVIDWHEMSGESPEAKMGRERDSVSMFPF